MSYEFGFNAGERKAFKDRRNGIVAKPSTREIKNERMRGYRDGYCSRCPEWAARSPDRAEQERDAA